MLIRYGDMAIILPVDRGMQRATPDLEDHRCHFARDLVAKDRLSRRNLAVAKCSTDAATTLPKAVILPSGTRP